MDNIYQILVERGYEECQAKMVERNLQSLDLSLKRNLEEWLISEKELDYNAHGMSLLDIMNRFSMKYPAALLTMDWVIKDPQTAMEAIKKGVK